MHQVIDLDPKHEVYIEVDNSIVAYGKVSYTQILVFDISGYMRKKDELAWKVLHPIGEWEH